MPQHSVLIVGCGSIGERHLRCFKNTGRANVTACDANPALLQKMADTYGVPVSNNWEAALQQKFDAVVICTPAPLHVPMARSAMEAGSHVLVEKPLSNSLEGAEELCALRDRLKRHVSVAYVLHVYPILVQAREFLRRAEFGPVRQVTVVTGQPFFIYRPAYAQTYYRDRRMGGGAIQDALTHSVNWVESVIGPSESVVCDCAHQVLPNVEVEDTAHVAIRHREALSSFSINQFQAPNESTYQFNAPNGSVKIETHNSRWGTFAAGATAWTWHDVPPLDRDGPFALQANAFLDQIEGKPSRLCTLEAGIATLRFNLSALASADTGRRVHCHAPHA
jgi:predicted dehydrogenase